MRILPAFFQDRRGNVAILFAFAAFPILALVGATVDYGRMSAAHTELQGATDAATLDTAIYVSQQLAQGTTPTSAAVTTQFQRMLAARAAITKQYSVASSSVIYTQSAGQVTLAATAHGTVVPKFGKILGKTSYSVAASSTVAKNLVSYSNISLVLDVSPSMAVAATAADIAVLQSKTSPACAFACHDMESATLPPPTGETNYDIARANNVTLRIDVVKAAAQQLTAYIPTVQSMPGQYSMGLYTMGSTLKTVVPPTTSLSAVNAGIATVDFDRMSVVVPTLNLPTSLTTNMYLTNYADSDFQTTLTSLNTLIPNPGTGASSTKPTQYVFLVTDGLNDIGNPVNSAVSATYAYPPVPNFTATGNDAGKTTSPLDPTWCNQFKNRGITVAVLYVTYVPNPTDPSGDYQWLVAQNAPPTQLVTNLTACASPGLFYQANNSTQVGAGLTTLFQLIATSPHLTH